jgi:hypothetical protein
MRKKQHHLPAVMFAQRVIAITPLFWRKNREREVEKTETV